MAILTQALTITCNNNEEYLRLQIWLDSTGISIINPKYPVISREDKKNKLQIIIICPIANRNW